MDMENEMKTPKSDLWVEIVRMINGFGNNYRHPTGLEVNTCLSEHQNLMQLIKGQAEWRTKEFGETQEDRNAELEDCVTEQDLNVILEFQSDLNEKVQEFKKMFE